MKIIETFISKDEMHLALSKYTSCPLVYDEFDKALNRLKFKVGRKLGYVISMAIVNKNNIELTAVVDLKKNTFKSVDVRNIYVFRAGLFNKDIISILSMDKRNEKICLFNSIANVFSIGFIFNGLVKKFKDRQIKRRCNCIRIKK